MNVFIDTNALLRFFLKDNLSQYQKVESLLKKSRQKQITIYTSHLTVAEFVWVLLSHYKVPKTEIIDNLKHILSLEELDISQSSILEHAVKLYEHHAIDFIDAYNAAFVLHKKESLIFSFDRDFDAVKEVKRIESVGN